QRPTGAVNDNIRANTALRIALRVQDRADSEDVVGSAEAALLPRDRPGRALVRFGPGELLTVQGAHTGGSRLSSPPPPVTLRGLGAASTHDHGPTGSSVPDPRKVRAGRASPSDLEELVGRMEQAWISVGGR